MLGAEPGTCGWHHNDGLALCRLRRHAEVAAILFVTCCRPWYMYTFLFFASLFLAFFHFN